MALKSANVTQGVDRAPNRSLFAALGFTKEETDRPLIGIVCSHNEIVPGHMNLDKIAEAGQGWRPHGWRHPHHVPRHRRL